MVDATRDAPFRLPTPPSDIGGPWKPNAHVPTGAGTIGPFGNLQDPPLPPVEDGGGRTVDGGKAPPGAPELPAPRQQLSPAEMAMQVSLLISRIDEAQSGVEQNGLKMDDTQKQEAFKKSNEAIAKAAKKLAQAKHKQKILGPLATIGKVLLSVAAVALAVCTAGAASPLAIAMITYTAIDTTLTIADTISKAAGGPALGLGDLMQDLFKAIAKGCGASESKAETIGKWAAFGVQAAIAVLTIAYSISNVYSLVKGTATAAGSLASKLGTTAMKATKIAGVATQAIGGATTATAGGLTIAAGIEAADAANARADKTHFDAMAAQITEAIHNTLERLQLIAADLSAGMQSAAKDISEIGQTNIDIAGGNVAMV